MDTSPEVPTNKQDACPNDTDGDGNCGKPACPHCGKFKLHQNVVFIEPQRDISDTPVPQRNTTQY